MDSMSPERWVELQRLLHQALDLPVESRARFVERVGGHDRALRAQLLELIAAAESPEDSLLDRPAAVLMAGTSGALSCETEMPELVGPYRVLERLESGGMGDVYSAERVGSYSQKVAVKVLRREWFRSDMILRFRHERQILADLEHPGIARLLDGGTTTDGRPYLAMEFVDGLPIDEYCRQKSLALEDRIRLFLQVCEAVHFAHQSLIVHRDLKPGNMLITAQGAPKLLDFGIAKWLDRASAGTEPSSSGPTTEFGSRPMTLAYAAPEQVLGNALTTATDVYSLGVLLFELLTARRPYAVSLSSPLSSVRSICEESAPKPSAAVGNELFELVARNSSTEAEDRRLKRRLTGDLDRIVTRAMAKDPRQRYRSVEQLSADLRRWTVGKPISVRPHTLAYRLSKFVLRHRISVASTVVFVGCLLCLSSALWWQRQESRRQQARAERVSEFLVELLSESDPDVARGRTVTVDEVLERGVARLGSELVDDAELRSELLLTMGRSFVHLGKLDRADGLLRESLQLLEERSLVGGRVYADSLTAMAELRGWQGRFEEAVQVGRRALEQWVSIYGEHHPKAVEARGRIARFQHQEGDWQGAEQNYSKALSSAEAGGRADLLVQVLERYALLKKDQARYDEAELLLAQALSLARRRWGEPDRRVAQVLGAQGVVLEARGRYESAEACFREALAMQMKLFEDPHPELATTRHNLAGLLGRAGRHKKALALFERVLAERRALLGERHPKVASTLGRLGGAHHRLGELDEAERCLREALEIRRAVLGEDHVDTAQSYRQLAQLMVDRGALPEAESTYQKALEIQKRRLGDGHPEVAVTLNNLAEVALGRGDLNRAAELSTKGLTILEEHLGPEHGDVAMARYNTAGIDHRLGHLDAAERGYHRALDGARSAFGADHRKVAYISASLASLLLARGNARQAAALSREALANFERDPVASTLWIDAARDTLCRSWDRGAENPDPVLLRCRALEPVPEARD